MEGLCVIDLCQCGREGLAEFRWIGTVQYGRNCPGWQKDWYFGLSVDNAFLTEMTVNLFDGARSKCTVAGECSWCCGGHASQTVHLESLYWRCHRSSGGYWGRLVTVVEVKSYCGFHLWIATKHVRCELMCCEIGFLTISPQNKKNKLAENGTPRYYFISSDVLLEIFTWNRIVAQWVGPACVFIFCISRYDTFSVYLPEEKGNEKR